ncbi:MAG: hypothetical protein NTX50_22305 [Candidatus Sumerlaeota bacterium]|nr:hypothetical protein [Candidatus Sumerlaeota bacterium]
MSVIRSLEDLIASSLRNQFGYLGPGIFKKEIKERALMLIERVINQNEQNLGLFYLHPDADAGISVRCVAVLRVSISVKANEHYRTLIAARVGRLQQAFQHRLGWMVGNLYSRVDVRDWKEDTEGKEEEELIQEIFRFNRMEPLWVASKTIRDALKRNTGFFDLPAQDQEKLLEECSPMPPKEAIIGRIGDILKECYPALQEEDVERIKKRLNNDDRFGAQIRRLSKP